MTSSSRKPAFPVPAPSFLEAVKLSKTRKGPPTEGDLPPVRPLPSPKPKVLPGQLDLEGNEVVKYLRWIPAKVPAGWVVVHNHVQPAHPLGWNGFRAWLAGPSDRLVVCGCDWAPGLPEHYRVNRDGGKAA